MRWKTLFLLTYVIVAVLLFSQTVYANPVESTHSVHWTSLLPPLVAIGLALLLREVVGSLLLGILVGTFLLNPGHPFRALLAIPVDLLPQALADTGHASIVIFSLLLGGMVGIMARSGGMAGLVQALSRLATTRRGAMLVTWLMGIIIFFDDYANTLLVGNTVRPYTDKLGISRAKLSYIVDSTAAPVASIAVISTWVGFEVGLIRDAAESLHLIDDAYILFLRSIPYSSYSLFALAMVAAIAWWGRDLQPMRSIEQDASKGNDSSKQLSDRDLMEGRAPGRHAILSALLPICMVILATFAGLYISGISNVPAGSSLSVILGASDSSSVLLAASFLGLVTAAVLSLIVGREKIGDVSEAMIDGMRAMIPAMVILLLAWSIGEVCTRLGTAEFIVDAVAVGMPPVLIPVSLFIISGLVAFSTGTSWGAMAILIPIALPIAHDIPLAAGMEQADVFHIILGSIGAVLAGATFGDHCSPISDTTILSSMASGCNHIDHVRSQIPYALITAGFAILFGYLPAGLGFYPLPGLLLGIVLLFALVRFFPPTLDSSTSTHHHGDHD
ncbi:Na+/H+ antiporter NhaC family protein [bacterium]|nr:Na+/H+ antiporter NhaC family protein [bacterium]